MAQTSEGNIRSTKSIYETGRPLILLWLVGVTLRSTILALPPVLPQATRDLGLNGFDVGLLTALPSLLFATAALPGSLLIARLGVLATLFAGLLVNALGTAARGFAGSALTLDLTTFAMCLGIAVMQPALPPLVRAWCPRRVGLATAVYTNGLLVGEVMPTAWIPQPVLPLVGGGWRATLTVWALPVLLTAVLLAAFGRDEHKATTAATPQWSPDWRDMRIWRLGLMLGATNATYFVLNGFLSGLLTAKESPGLVQPVLITLNLAQVPASLLLMAFADRLVRQPVVYGTVYAVMLASIVGLVAMPTNVAIVWAGFGGFACAVLLTLALALPSLITSHANVPRVSAAMFTISYALSMVCSLLGGTLWTLTGAVTTAFLPAGLAALLATMLGFRLTREDFLER